MNMRSITKNDALTGGLLALSMASGCSSDSMENNLNGDSIQRITEDTRKLLSPKGNDVDAGSNVDSGDISDTISFPDCFSKIKKEQTANCFIQCEKSYLNLEVKPHSNCSIYTYDSTELSGNSQNYVIFSNPSGVISHGHFDPISRTLGSDDWITNVEVSSTIGYEYDSKGLIMSFGGNMLKDASNKSNIVTKYKIDAPVDINPNLEDGNVSVKRVSLGTDSSPMSLLVKSPKGNVYKSNEDILPGQSVDLPIDAINEMDITDFDNVKDDKNHGSEDGCSISREKKDIKSKDISFLWIAAISLVASFSRRRNR